MFSSEHVGGQEQGEDLSPAALFNRFEEVAKKLMSIWAPRLEARLIQFRDWGVDDQIKLASGDTAQIHLCEHPKLDRESGKIHSGSIVTGNPKASGESTHYFFARRLGDITELDTPLITTFEAATDGKSRWLEDKDLSNDSEALSRVAALLSEIEDAVDFRIANPIESIPVDPHL